MSTSHNLDFLSQLLGEEPTESSNSQEHTPTNGELFDQFVQKHFDQNN